MLDIWEHNNRMSLTMSKSFKITWVRVRWLVSFTPTLQSTLMSSVQSRTIQWLEYLGDFSVNHFVKSKEKCGTGRQTITNMYLLNNVWYNPTFPSSQCRLSLPASVSRGPPCQARGRGPGSPWPRAPGTMSRAPPPAPRRSCFTTGAWARDRPSVTNK